MPVEILMPALSPTMEEGTLAKWLIKEGDRVSAGDVIAEIETDKATMEFEAVDEGTLGRILVAEGSAGVRVNTPIAVLLEEGESEAGVSGAPTTPTTAPAPDPEPGTQAAENATKSKDPGASPGREHGDDRRLFASPLARRLAAEKGLDLSTLTGTGPHGRIVKADVERAATAPQSKAPVRTEAQSRPAPPQTASFDTIAKIYADRSTTEVPLDGMRKTIAARLTEAKQTIPHFYLRRDVRLDPLLRFRAEINAQLAARKIKLSVNDFIIKSCALALQQVPDANAIWAGDRLLRLGPSDVAVAVAIEGGLFTPVLRDAEAKSLSVLSAEMKDLAARARDRKLAPQDYQGGSFAVSNLGMYGIDSFDAVINPPHGAILAVGAGVKKPVVLPDGTLGVATVMSLTLSVDHRVIDGTLGAELLAAIVQNLENPVAMLV